MKQKTERILLLLLCGGLWLALAVWTWVKPADAYSYSERRDLAQMPAFSLQSFFAGDFHDTAHPAAALHHRLTEGQRLLIICNGI